MPRKPRLPLKHSKLKSLHRLLKPGRLKQPRLPPKQKYRRQRPNQPRKPLRLNLKPPRLRLSSRCLPHWILKPRLLRKLLLSACMISSRIL